jgi:hypothetical protein
VEEVERGRRKSKNFLPDFKSVSIARNEHDAARQKDDVY